MNSLQYVLVILLPTEFYARKCIEASIQPPLKIHNGLSISVPTTVRVNKTKKLKKSESGQGDHGRWITVSFSRKQKRRERTRINFKKHKRKKMFQTLLGVVWYVDIFRIKFDTKFIDKKHKVIIKVILNLLKESSSMRCPIIL